MNMLCDIGNGTMNIMYINHGRPVSSQCFTEKYGTHQCMLAAREAVIRTLHLKVPDITVENVLRNGCAEDMDSSVNEVVCQTAKDYVAGIMRSLREHEYDPRLMLLWFMGGGACLVQHFGPERDNRIHIIDDIQATTKGYYRLAAKSLMKRGIPFEE